MIIDHQEFAVPVKTCTLFHGEPDGNRNPIAHASLLAKDRFCVCALRIQPGKCALRERLKID